MKDTESGFTMLETLLSVSIILIVGSVFVVVAGVTKGGITKAVYLVNTSAVITRIDRHIRTKVDSVHVPYWADPAPYISELTDELYLSKIGPYIKAIQILTNSHNTPRGIEVLYTVNSKEIRTVALLPSVPVMEKKQ